MKQPLFSPYYTRNCSSRSAQCFVLCLNVKMRLGSCSVLHTALAMSAFTLLEIFCKISLKPVNFSQSTLVDYYGIIEFLLFCCATSPKTVTTHFFTLIRTPRVFLCCSYSCYSFYTFFSDQ